MAAECTVLCEKYYGHNGSVQSLGEGISGGRFTNLGLKEATVKKQSFALASRLLLRRNCLDRGCGARCGVGGESAVGRRDGTKQDAVITLNEPH